MATVFDILSRDQASSARAGVLHTAHGDVSTPCFMPIATTGAVHHVAPHELRELGATIVLANTYHLTLRPGTPYLAERGGLQGFMGWNGPLLTDSGGFQVFSLGARATARGGSGFVAFSDDGVRFRSHLDGSERLFTPENVMEHQRDIGSDIAMVLDVCPPQPCSRDDLADAVRRTTLWAERAIAHADAIGARPRMRVFGIVQGGSDEKLRAESAHAITALPFDGFAIGGVAVGEAKAAMRRAVEMTAPLLPADRPRYLMGVGTPDDIVHAVGHGIDIFDCVLPTRDARHGRVYRQISNSKWASTKVSFRAAVRNPTPFVLDNTKVGFVEVPKFQISDSDPWYETINIGNERWKDVDAPIDPTCACLTCRNHSLAYLRHLTAIGEPLGQRLLSLHNLAFYLSLMRELRERIIHSAAV